MLPLDGDVIIYVGIFRQGFQLDSMEAFRVPKGTFVKLNPLIVHGTQYVTDQEEAEQIEIL
ncbi:MAG: hypothetical protein OSJ52_09510 [Lachnospiraceae bacterium]|nr:hypothetical protein [Lachnospiraceae bacterium]